MTHSDGSTSVKILESYAMKRLKSQKLYIFYIYLFKWYQNTLNIDNTIVPTLNIYKKLVTSTIKNLILAFIPRIFQTVLIFLEFYNKMDIKRKNNFTFSYFETCFVCSSYKVYEKTDVYKCLLLTSSHARTHDCKDMVHLPCSHACLYLLT